jgi:hypothetical protein
MATIYVIVPPHPYSSNKIFILNANNESQTTYEINNLKNHPHPASNWPLFSFSNIITLQNSLVERWHY